MSLGKRLPNVGFHALAKLRRNLARFEPFFQLLDRPDAELFVDAQHARGVQAWKGGDGSHFRADLSPKSFELPQRAAYNQLPNRAADPFADTGISGQIGALAYQIVEALGQAPDGFGGAPVDLDLAGGFPCGPREVERGPSEGYALSNAGKAR
jgi:hypothetical protein